MTWQQVYNEFINIAPGIGQVAIRLACAMIIGIVIGLEREFTHRPAGLRTHILVVLGACVVSVTGEMLFAHYASLGATPDPARLSAQVITGVGFLGAGTIMKEGANVKGLTTAASVWAVACLGIACGFGYYILALLGMVFIMLTLTVIEALQHKLIHDHSSEVGYILETSDISATLSRLNTLTYENAASLTDFSAEQIDGGHRLSFRASFSGRRRQEHHRRFFNALATAPETRQFQIQDAKLGNAV